MSMLKTIAIGRGESESQTMVEKKRRQLRRFRLIPCRVFKNHQVISEILKNHSYYSEDESKLFRERFFTLLYYFEDKLLVLNHVPTHSYLCALDEN